MSRSAIVSLVADLLASRKVTGCAAHSASCFCSLCTLQKKDINNLDPTTWSRRTPSEHRALAYQWLTAPTKAAQNNFYRLHGVRWSELLRLPYWNPTHSAPVDVMHNLFLGLLRFHCREVLRLGCFERETTIASKEVGLGNIIEEEASPKELARARKALHANATISVLRR